MAPPRTPAGLSTAGRRLWRMVIAAYELRVDELRVLEDAAREADVVARIEAALTAEPLLVVGSTGQTRPNGLLTELRGHRALLATLLRQLDLPDLSRSAGRDAAATSAAARKAAATRWDRQLGRARGVS